MISSSFFLISLWHRQSKVHQKIWLLMDMSFPARRFAKRHFRHCLMFLKKYFALLKSWWSPKLFQLNTNYLDLRGKPKSWKLPLHGWKLILRELEIRCLTQNRFIYQVFSPKHSIFDQMEEELKQQGFLQSEIISFSFLCHLEWLLLTLHYPKSRW